MSESRFANKGIWKCFTCKVEKPATVHQLRRKNCSKDCMAADYKKRFSGEKNPNFSGAAVKICIRCGIEYSSYSKSRKFCSHSCYTESKRKDQLPKKEKKEKQTKICVQCSKVFPCNATSSKTTCSDECAQAKRDSTKLYKSCLQCGKQFRYYKSQTNKRYCSYECHLQSGGAFRAGIASSEARMKYGAKKDANHNDIVNEMRKYCAFYDLSSVGGGVPDGVAWVNNAWHLIDIKNPKTAYGKRGLNDIQKKWLSQWAGGPVYLIYTVEEGVRFAQGNFEGIKFFQGGLVDK